jgi:hypothetical protein
MEALILYVVFGALISASLCAVVTGTARRVDARFLTPGPESLAKSFKAGAKPGLKSRAAADTDK